MLTSHIHDAMQQVREIRQRVIERQRFRGYSGRTRFFSGCLALLTAWIMSAEFYPTSMTAHLFGWGVLCVIAIGISLAALLHWYLYDPVVRRDPQKLRPALDALPPLLVGGALTLALLMYGQTRFLFGVWMCLAGLVNFSTQHVMPREIKWLGYFYIANGCLCLLWPGISFLNPWPMGLVFFFGECAGGWIVHRDRYPGTSWLSLIIFRREAVR